jgi:hypothetical protein
VYFADLSPYRYGAAPSHPDFLNVGWLGKDQPFAEGDTSAAFLLALEVLVKSPVNLYRGRHYCEFCPGPQITRDGLGVVTLEEPPEQTWGNGEIRVLGDDGKTYIAPTLILHYVAKHKYLPPAAFIEACVRYGNA